MTLITLNIISDFFLVKRKIKTNLNSTRLDDHAEISIIETPEKVGRMTSPEKELKPKQNTPRSKFKPSFDVKKIDVKPSPSILTKKKHSPKSAKKKTVGIPANGSPISTPRPRRNIVRNPIFDTDDESDKENESDWSDDNSYSDSDILTDDDSDKKTDKVPKPKSLRGKNAAGASASKRPAKKTDKNELIYLDLSSEEIVRVDEKYHANVSEEDLANITRKFLDADLNLEE